MERKAFHFIKADITVTAVVDPRRETAVQRMENNLTARMLTGTALPGIRSAGRNWTACLSVPDAVCTPACFGGDENPALEFMGLMNGKKPGSDLDAGLAAKKSAEGNRQIALSYQYKSRFPSLY